MIAHFQKSTEHTRTVVPWARLAFSHHCHAALPPKTIPAATATTVASPAAPDNPSWVFGLHLGLDRRLTLLLWLVMEGSPAATGACGSERLIESPVVRKDGAIGIGISFRFRAQFEAVGVDEW